ncbi:hypothetical protein NM688_g4599 [Phlebia brevispora]|uniref:Uncharacterized protein n=1 Tax=Phlebia brevispora TaxID=194682 RepID=A0ACC1T2F8_9APHY|nr:hypothetical protein NM688_g4599 [Phlebia brevispora]
MYLAQFISLNILVAFSIAAPQVDLNGTILEGRSFSLLNFPQEAFGNIPYAYAPRFSSSQPRSLNTLTFDASQFGALCPQVNPAHVGISEDCLTVNIVRPVLDNPAGPLPVMIWLFQGFFEEGQARNGSLVVLNSVLRDTPIIHVDMFYRVGPFGFPQGAEAAQRGALNLGLKDQIMGFEWIQSNIAAFGRDPKKVYFIALCVNGLVKRYYVQVTLFGMDAGAISISLHYLNTNLANYAHATIMQSGSQASIALFGPELRQPAWDTFANATPECAGASPNSTFDCLRQANLSTLLTSWEAANASWGYDGSIPQMPFAPVIDGENGVIPDLPFRLLAEGRFAHVPFIAGTVLDEGTNFTPRNVNFTDEAEVIKFIETEDQPYMPNPSAAYKAALNSLLALYPDNPALGSPYGTGNNTFSLNPGFKRVAAIVGDLAFQALRRAWIQAATKAGVKTYGYLFTQASAATPSQLFFGVQHESDIGYTYGDKVLTGAVPDIQLSFNVLDYWVSFATTLDPNDGFGLSSRIHWDPYDSDKPAVLQLSSNMTMIPDDYHKTQIDYINANAAIFGH